jgi:hypothetical protein
METDLERLVELLRLANATAKEGVYSVIGGLLFFSDRNAGNLRLCIPDTLVEEVLKQCHDRTGHPGIRRLGLSLSTRYYFPRMSRRIRAYINECAICQTSKPSNKKPAGKLYPIITPELHHTLCFDFVTGLPRSKGRDAILTVTEKYSKAVKLIPCNMTTSASDTSRLYLTYCYTTFGLPARIISDRDGRFVSHFWATLTTMLDIHLGMTAAYHPSADGQSERMNQTIEVALRCFLGGDQKKYA